MNRHRVVSLFVAAIGIMSGLAIYTFTYAEGFSYFSSDPRSCANCHIMNDPYDSWSKSSHHAAAVCVDCHMPHDSIVAKIIAKADNGFRHSKGFTLQDFHEPIMITPRNSEILQANCMRCHSDLIHGIAMPESNFTQLRCVQCHSHAGHGSLR